MASGSDAELMAAEALGRKMLKSEPRAVAARFEAATGRMVVELMNGCVYAFPPGLVQDLQGAGPEALMGVIVDGAGFNLHWPALDVDLYVPALVAGVFGTSAWMRQGLARLAGQARTPAKRAAARANGAKGGRPRKTA
jgi:hypothetical protein